MLNEQILADLMKSEVNAITSKTPAGYQDAYFLALATAIIQHFKTSGEVYSGTCIPNGNIKDGKIK